MNILNRIAVAVATLWVIVGFATTQIFPHSLVLLFNNKNKELLAMGTSAMRIFLMMLPLIGFQIVSSSYFQAVGKPKPEILLSLSRQVLFLIPLIIILPHFFGLKGLWFSGPIAYLLSSLLTGIWLLIEIQRLNKQQYQNVAIEPGLAK